MRKDKTFKKCCVHEMRKLISCFLSIVIVMTVCPFINVRNASATSSEMEKAIAWAIAIANDNSHGYSQAKRNGPDYDCSSLISYALKNAGIYDGNAFATSTMQSILPKYGFTYVSGTASLERGDILWRNGHTELYIGNGQTVAAHSDRGYPQTGDQTGTEINVQSMSGQSWTGYFRYKAIVPDPVPDPVISAPKLNIEVNGQIATFSWDEVPNANSYDLKIEYADGTTYKNYWDFVDKKTFQVTLPANTKFQAALGAKNSNYENCYKYCNWINFDTNTAPIISAPKLNVEVNGQIATFSWDEVPNANSYDLKIEYADGTTYKNYWDFVDKKTFQVTLPANTKFQVALGAKNSNYENCYKYCNWINFDTNTAPIISAPKLNVEVNGQIATFSWDEVPNANSYDLKIEYADGTTYKNYWDFVDKKTFQVTLPANTKFQVALGAKNSNYENCYKYCNWINFDTNTAPIISAPKLNVEVNGQIATFSWDEVPNANSYDLKIEYADGTTYKNYWDFVDKKTFQVTLPANTKFQVALGAKNSNYENCYKYCNWINFDTNTAPIISAPKLNVEVNGQIATFSWDEVPNANSYDLKIEYADGTTYKNYWDFVDKKTFQVTLPANTKFQVALGAKNSNYENCYKYCNWINFDTNTAPMITSEPTTTKPVKKTSAGDTNLDGKVDISDVVAVRRYVANSEKNPMSEQALSNADVVGNNGVNAQDAVAIMQSIFGLISL